MKDQNHVQERKEECKTTESQDGFMIENGVLVKFKGNSKDVVIPNCVTSIGGMAFANCDFLTNVTLPDSVTSIGEGAFCSCTSLKSVIIPNSVTSIGAIAFTCCHSLKSITIPSCVTSIGGLAFSSCSKLESIVVEPGNAKYRSENNCLIDTATNSLICGCKNSVIPSGVTSIGEGAFLGCSSLKNITIPNSVTTIGEGAFLFCNSLNTITIPTSVIEIGENAFGDDCKVIRR